MPWISYSQKTKTSSKLVRQGLERLRKAIPLIGRKRIYDAAVEIRKRMKTPGKKPTYPIQWDSVKQRKAFFASNGFGRGIPTKRSGTYTKNWQVIKTANGYDVGNPLSWAQYVGGTARGARQSSIHKGRWPVFRRQVEIVINKLPLTVRRAMKLTARNLGFRTSE